jgi:hypothetical protein
VKHGNTRHNNDRNELGTTMHTLYDDMLGKSCSSETHPARVSRVVDSYNEAPVSIPKRGHRVAVPLWLIRGVALQEPSCMVPYASGTGSRRMTTRSGLRWSLILRPKLLDRTFWLVW